VLWSGGRDLAASAFLRAPQGARHFLDRPEGELRDWLVEGFRRGESIVVPRAHRLFPAVAALSRDAANELGGRCAASLVLAPADGEVGRAEAGCAGPFAAETLVIQVEGSQDACLWDPPCRSPLEGQLEPASGPPSSELALEAGDLLYLPGGTPFVLRPDAGSSLHVALHLEPYRWLDLLGDMIELSAQESVALRQCARHGSAAQAGAALLARLRDGTGPPEHFQAKWMPVRRPEMRPINGLERIRDADQTRAALAAAAISLWQRRRVSQAEPLPGSCLTAPPPRLTADAWLALVDGALCFVARAGDQATIEFAARRQARVSGPALIEPALRFIEAARAPFRVSELAGLGSLEEQLVLANRLIAEGLLCVRERKS